MPCVLHLSRSKFGLAKLVKSCKCAHKHSSLASPSAGLIWPQHDYRTLCSQYEKTHTQLRAGDHHPAHQQLQQATRSTACPTAQPGHHHTFQSAAAGPFRFPCTTNPGHSAATPWNGTPATNSEPLNHTPRNHTPATNSEPLNPSRRHAQNHTAAARPTQTPAVVQYGLTYRPVLLTHTPCANSQP